MLYTKESMRYGILVVRFPSSRFIVDQLYTWDLDMMTLNRQISEDSLTFKNSDI